MKVNLRRLEYERDGRGTWEAEETVTLTDAFDQQRDVDCRVELSWERRGSAIFFHGDVSGELLTQCHRCLVDVTTPLQGSFDVVVRRGDVRGVTDDEADEVQDLVTLSPSQHEFTLDPYIIENLIVNIPMQILCREDCKGLCPQCGINRNETSCDCVETPDSRWDALRKPKND
jgi:uncharacterized protein